MKKRLILCIVGMPDSGKTFAGKLVKKHFSAYMISSGDIIRKEVKNRGLRYSPTADEAVASWFHEKGRWKIIVEKTWNRAKRRKEKIIIIDGFRSPEEVKYLEIVAKTKPIVIAITAPFRLRAKREIARGRFGKNESMDYLRSRDKIEKERGEGKLIRRAKYKVKNTGTVKQLEKIMISLVKKLQKCDK